MINPFDTGKTNQHAASPDLSLKPAEKASRQRHRLPLLTDAESPCVVRGGLQQDRPRYSPYITTWAPACGHTEPGRQLNP